MLEHGSLDIDGIDEVQAHRHAMRHSAAHVMADAVLKLFPEAKMGIGPPTQDGFYYDFDVSRPFTPEKIAFMSAGRPFALWDGAESLLGRGDFVSVSEVQRHPVSG